MWGAPPRDDQISSLEEEANGGQTPVNPLHLKDDYIRASLIQLAQAVITQSQAMTAKDNREVVPRQYQQVIAIASHL